MVVDSAIFLALAVVLGVLGPRFRDSLANKRGASTTQMLPRSPQAFAALNGCLVFAFALRAVMQISLLYSDDPVLSAFELTPSLIKSCLVPEYDATEGGRHEVQAGCFDCISECLAPSDAGLKGGLHIQPECV